MPFEAGYASTAAAVLAPDGIAIHPFAVAAAAHAGVVEGRIPPGRYSIHRHLSLEQYTYVISGVLTVVTGTDAHTGGRSVTVTDGGIVLTLPGETLQFINAGEETARVLFICAPPYPADDSDTRLHAAHGPMPEGDIPAAIARLETVRAEMNAAIDSRLAALRAKTT